MKLCLPFKLVCLLLLCAPVVAQAQTYPSKPIRLLVPYAAGGTTDQMARLLGKGLGDLMGQQVLIDNRPGAAGAIAVEQTARAAPDGYTLVFGNSAPNAILPAIRPLSYDPLKDLAPISIVAKTPLLWAVSHAMPVRSMAEFVELAKSKPGVINFGSTGMGSVSHLAAEHFAHLAGIRMLHIPFTGGAPAMLAMRRGDIQAMFVTGLDGRAQVEAGTIRYLAIGTPNRTSLAPELPAISETIPGFTAELWFGVLAPAGTPPEIRSRLETAIGQVMADPQLQKAFRDKMAEPAPSTQETLARTIREELALWGRLVKEMNLKLD